MLTQWIIEHKRDGHPLTDEEIRHFVDGYSSGDIPDYQAAALAMAIYFQGMDERETATLTEAMMRSGDCIAPDRYQKPSADKHSTGGVGDKVSLVLAPLAAALELAVPMISGRGLGITGGTLDKMESIPGYNCNQDTETFIEIVNRVGCSIIGQTRRLAPADRKLYALRDVTATVPCLPLIVSSIMSKKLAEGASVLVLDVKWGAGAFMKTPEEARRLGQALVATGQRMGRRVRVVLSRMDQPLGRAAGNAPEVREALDCLRGQGPDDLWEVTRELTAWMLVLAGRFPTMPDARDACDQARASGSALEKFREMIAAHGADPHAIDRPDWLPPASHTREILAPRPGYLHAVDAQAIGKACVLLGAGRQSTEDKVDPAAGIDGLPKIGERVEQDAPLCRLHAGDNKRLEEAARILPDAFHIADDVPATHPLITESFGDEAANC